MHPLAALDKQLGRAHNEAQAGARPRTVARVATLYLRSADDAFDLDATLADGSTPLHVVIDSGLRAVVNASVDGVDVAMLVHANAGFLAMLTHHALYRINGRRVGKEVDFGLGHDLELSRSGRGHTELRMLEVAGAQTPDPRIEVFDLPTVNWDGMLGLDWLASTGAVVDFGRARLAVPADAGARTALLAELDGRAGAVPLTRDLATGRFLCGLSLDGDAGSVSRFVASTVGDTTIDIACARRHGIEPGEQIGEEHGPGGAVVPAYRARRPVTFSVGGIALATITPEIHDIYAYSGNPRPDEGELVDGCLGADLLAARSGVIDFGV